MLKLVMDVPNSNRDWKSQYFLFKARIGCVDLMSGIVYGDKYDNTWGILNKAGESSILA